MDARPIDADNHYYEPLDAFTRHLDKEFEDRGVRPVQDGKRVRAARSAGKVNRFVPNPTFDPIIVPGCLDPLFRGQIPEGVDPRTLMQVEPLRAEYQDRDRRLEVMDEQGLGAALLFPTLGCGVEEALRDDIPATMASLSAFNRWLEEDWGFAYQDRILAAPMLSLADPDAAVAEVESLLERGVRIVHVRPAPVPGPERHQPVARRQAPRSGLGPAGRGRRSRSRFHLGDSGYTALALRGRGAAAATFGLRQQRRARPGPRLRPRDPRHDRVDARRTACSSATRRCGSPASRTARTGCTCSPSGCASRRNQTPWVFAEDPLDTLRRHVWVTPYLEEDLAALADLIGVERILFGSDWPHGEGVAQPLDFEKELAASTSRPCSGSCTTTASSSSAPRERRDRGAAAAARRALGRGHRLARGALGPRPHRRGVVEGVGRGRLDGAPLPDRAGRARPEPSCRARGARRVRRRSARCARPAASAS